MEQRQNKSAWQQFSNSGHGIYEHIIPVYAVYDVCYTLNAHYTYNTHNKHSGAIL